MTVDRINRRSHVVISQCLHCFENFFAVRHGEWLFFESIQTVVRVLALSRLVVLDVLLDCAVVAVKRLLRVLVAFVLRQGIWLACVTKILGGTCTGTVHQNKQVCG